MKPANALITARLSWEERLWLEKQAKRKERTLSWLVRRIVQLHILKGAKL